MLSVPESTSFTRRLSVKTAPQKPRIIIVGFQTAKDGDQTKNTPTFDHVNLLFAYVTLHSDRYPVVDYNLSFANQKFCREYGDAALFGVKLLLLLLIKYETDTVTLSQPNVAGALYKVSEDMPMSVNA